MSESSFPLLYLVVIGFATSVISLYYYLKILKAAYNKTTEENVDDLFVREPYFTTRLVLILGAVLILFGGCFPQFFINLFL